MKLARRDDLCRLPELREMPQIPGDEVIRTRDVGAFEEHIVVGSAGHVQVA